VEVKGNNQLGSLFTRKLLVFTGKGGVGKTTLASALAIRAASTGKRVLLAEVSSPRRIPALFGAAPQTNGPQQIHENITWINLTAATALETYAIKILRFRSVYRAVFEQRAVRRFLRAVPSLAEILTLGHLTHLLEGGEFDLAVVDAPSSGPGAQMLETPRAVLDSAPRGPLRDGAAWIQKLLGDPKQAAINLVVVPEELPVSEAVSLFQRLRAMDMPLGMAFVNRTLNDPFFPDGKQVFDAAGELELGRELASASSLWRSRLRLQETYLDRLRAGLDLPVILLPEVFERPSSSAVVDLLSGKLSENPEQV
jgi:anion-transporting  ArsA/GET3 family ATPase